MGNERAIATTMELADVSFLQGNMWLSRMHKKNTVQAEDTQDLCVIQGQPQILSFVKLATFSVEDSKSCSLSSGTQKVQFSVEVLHTTQQSMHPQNLSLFAHHPEPLFPRPLCYVKENP